MTRLTAPQGTVVHADGALAEQFKAQGWTEDQPEATEPARAPQARRTRKTTK